MKQIIFAIFLFEILSIHAWAFDSQKCRQEITRLNLTYSGDLSPFTTSAQTTSSCGECSLFGLREERETFVEVNIQNIKNDAARGSGEYIATLSELYRCPSLSHDLGTILMENYTQVFGGNSTSGIESVLKGLDNTITNSPHLKACAI